LPRIVVHKGGVPAVLPLFVVLASSPVLVDEHARVGRVAGAERRRSLEFAQEHAGAERRRIRSQVKGLVRSQLMLKETRQRASTDIKFKLGSFHSHRARSNQWHRFLMLRAFLHVTDVGPVYVAVRTCKAFMLLKVLDSPNACTFVSDHFAVKLASDGTLELGVCCPSVVSADISQVTQQAGGV
jgi:hypothetical protein